MQAKLLKVYFFTQYYQASKLLGEGNFVHPHMTLAKEKWMLHHCTVSPKLD